MSNESSSFYTVFGMRAEAERIAPGLHVVATPIGNLRDISLRALTTLASANAVLAEDTRVSRTLLAHYGITTPLIAYHEHNAAEMRPKIMKRLAAGEALALISDAGTPLVSDPGYRLVRAAREAGIAVTSLPGPSAAIVGITLSGLPSDRFLFAGFLPPKEKGRADVLGELAAVPATLVFYETAPRLTDALASIAACLPGREVAVARELTKLYEECRSGTPEELIAHYSAHPPRGEIVLMIGPAPVIESTMADAETLLRAELAHAKPSQAAGAVAKATGLDRKALYALALSLK